MRGITLLEILISLAIVGLALLILGSAFSIFRGGSLLTEVETTIIGIVRDARARTLGSESNNQYGVHFASSTITLFAGSAYSEGAAGNEVYTLPVGVQISVADFGGNSHEVVFARLTGLPSSAGSVTVQLISDPAKTKTISILSSGIIE